MLVSSEVAFEGARKVATPLAIGQLKRLAVRPRLAMNASKRAKREQLLVTFRGLYDWLGMQETQDQLSAGRTKTIERSIRRLEFISGTRRDETRRDATMRLLDIVLDEQLRVVDAPTAVALAASRKQNEDTYLHQQTRQEVVKAIEVASNLDPTGNEELLDGFHPWTREDYRSLEGVWRNPAAIRALTDSSQRGTTVRQWVDANVTLVQEAPAPALLWLASIARDYSEPLAASELIGLAISRGVSDSGQWRARQAYLLLSAEQTTQAEALLSGEASNHPLGKALLASIQKDFPREVSTLKGWTPVDVYEQCLQRILLCGAYCALDDQARAIVELKSANASFPASTAVKLFLSRLLLARGRSRESLQPVQDFLESKRLAILARDQRRNYDLDSADAVIVAMQASVLAHDVDGAWNLVRPVPEGTATEAEALDSRVVTEAGVLAAGRGDLSLAEELVAAGTNKSMAAWVGGARAESDGDHETALALWRGAWDAAERDEDRMRAALSLARAGGDLPDLTELALLYPQEVAHLKTLHAVMRAPGDTLAKLRAHANDSVELSVELAEHYRSEGRQIDAAVVLSSAAQRWNDALVMKMSAYCYFNGRDFTNCAA